MNANEQQIRNRLGIPETAQYVLILDQSAHMDWDWLVTFEEYFTKGTALPGTSPPNAVRAILKEAFQLLANSTPANPYYYSICEMGYFRRFVSTRIEKGVDIVSIIHSAADFLRIVGGGITSPDCLLSSGESFIRNYLLGKLWLAELFPELLPLKHCWIPDDFGQDPELPVAVRAMGMTSISFSRMPGTQPGGPDDTKLEMVFLKNGADFNWIASDQASSVFTHWMPGTVPGYYQGGNLAKSGGTQQAIVNAIQSFLKYNNPDLTTYKPPFSAAPANYVYMPLDDDFMYPIAGLLDYVSKWNNSSNTETGGVFAVEASYDDFVSLVLASGTPLDTRDYNGTAYFTGYYASRPELKILHYGTTRLLLAAEILGLLASGTTPGTLHPSYWRRVFHTWQNLAPSTHHDYICGTALDSVTNRQQIPLLTTAHDEARSAAAEALHTLLGAVEAAVGDVVVVNASGISFTGPVELPAPVPAGMNSINIASAQNPVQPTFEGGLVFQAQMPSLSYSVATLSTESVTNPSPAQISPSTSGADSYTLQNEFLTVTVSAGQNWGISSIADSSGGLLQQGATGNDLIFYADQGNLYQFANEIQSSGFVPVPLQIVTSRAGLGATILEPGPVRVRLQTVVSIAVKQNGVPQASQNYTREYYLVAGEPFLRMTTTGAAPSNFSVMAAFPLGVESILHGTPCHWTSKQPHEFWTAPVFRATHHFLLPQANDTALAPIYHRDTPAWGYDANGVLLGCLLRNTPNGGRGAYGSDSGVHTLHYVMRSPVGLGAPTSGQPLAEAMNYAMPAVAGIVPPDRTSPQVLPATRSIASVSPPGFILAAKPGDVTPGTLILRIYQPSNSPHLLTVTLGQGRPASVMAVTALEDPITNGAPVIQITDSGFTIEAVTALNTVQISFAD